MEEVKNENIAETESVAEEVIEVALADEAEAPAEKEKVSDGANELTDNYTEFELSGLTDKQRRKKEIFEKITTGLLILLMASPILIILYIFLWFILR